MEKTYNYPVWATQGGGLVREVGDVYIFVEKPNCPGLDVGDIIPEEWSIVPANDLARDEMDEADEWGPDDQAMFDTDFSSIMDILFEKAEAGEISYDQIGQFFPQHFQEEARRYEVSNA